MPRRKALPASVLSLALLAALSRAAEPAPDGAVTVLELTSLTRERAAVWLRTVLPRASQGDTQTFSGEVAVAGVPVPVEQPVRVAIQPRADGARDAVFFLDLLLEKTPALLLAKASGPSAEVSVRGSLQGGGIAVPVWAVGTLRAGTGDVRVPRTAAVPFARFAGARFVGLSLSETEGEATAVLYNPFPYPVDIKHISYTLFSGDRKLCSGARHGIRVHGGRESEVTLPLSAKNTDLLAAAGSAVAGGGRLEGRLLGSVTLKLGGEETTFPVDLPGTIEVIR